MDNHVDLGPVTALSIDLFDRAIDTFIDSGIADGFPILRFITTAFYKAPRALSDYFLRDKLIAVISECRDISDSKVNKLLKKLENENAKEKVCRNILYLIDRMDSAEKAKPIGRLLKQLINEDIDRDVFFRLCHIINKLFISDINLLLHFENDNTVLRINDDDPKKISYDDLLSCGLLIQEGFSYGMLSGEGGPTSYSLSEYGKVLRGIL